MFSYFLKPETIQFSDFPREIYISYHQKAWGSNFPKWKMLVTSHCLNIGLSDSKSVHSCDKRYLEDFSRYLEKNVLWYSEDFLRISEKIWQRFYVVFLEKPGCIASFPSFTGRNLKSFIKEATSNEFKTIPHIDLYIVLEIYSFRLRFKRSKRSPIVQKSSQIDSLHMKCFSLVWDLVLIMSSTA